MSKFIDFHIVTLIIMSRVFAQFYFIGHYAFIYFIVIFFFIFSLYVSI